MAPARGLRPALLFEADGKWRGGERQVSQGFAIAAAFMLRRGKLLSLFSDSFVPTIHIGGTYEIAFT
jgi:hypothetical protein